MATPRSTDVSVVVTGHGEGDLCRPTFASLARAVRVALDAGTAVDVVGVLDRADGATATAFSRALGDSGEVGALVPTQVLRTDHGDPGRARNSGIDHARGAWVCVLDADNLVSSTWLREAYRLAEASGGPCVVHPEALVIFGDRWQVWPQIATGDPGFDAHNFFDRTYWDTFCLAARDVFRRQPYRATSAGVGLGPEDWHWGMETVHAGIPHLTAVGTALFYRSKPEGSIQKGHDQARSLLPPSALLTDPGLARNAVLPAARTVEWRGLQRAVVRQQEGATARLTRLLERAGRPSAGADDLAAVASPSFHLAHYRALNREALHLRPPEALAHYLELGRRQGLRARLTAAELADVAELDLADYRELHPDLAPLGDDQLLHHYLVHGRAEHRATVWTTEHRDARSPVVLSEALREEMREMHAIDPDVPEPTAAAMSALRRTGPPSDGSTTIGSSVWWQVVARLGPRPPEHLVLTSNATALVATGADPGTVLVATDQVADPERSPQHPAVVSLPDIPGWRRLAPVERRRLLATLVIQSGAPRVSLLGSAELAGTLDDYGTILRSFTSVTG